MKEGRVLVVDAQVVSGCFLQLAFKRAFTELPYALQLTQLGGLFVMVFALGMLLLLPAYHRITESGRATQRLLSLSQTISKIALFAFALATGIAVTLSGWKILTPRAAT